jgi:hypothetical protein
MTIDSLTLQFAALTVKIPTVANRSGGSKLKNKPGKYSHPAVYVAVQTHMVTEEAYERAAEDVEWLHEQSRDNERPTLWKRLLRKIGMAKGRVILVLIRNYFRNHTVVSLYVATKSLPRHAPKNRTCKGNAVTYNTR